MNNLFTNQQTSLFQQGKTQQSNLFNNQQQQQQSQLFSQPGQQNNLFANQQNQNPQQSLFQGVQNPQQSLFQQGGNLQSFGGGSHLQNQGQNSLYQQTPSFSLQPMQQMNQQSLQQQAQQSQQQSQQLTDLNNMMLVFQGYNTKQFCQKDKELLQKTYGQRFVLAFGNSWQNKTVKDINEVNNQLYKLTDDMTLKLQQDQKLQKQIQSKNQETEQGIINLQNNIYRFSQEAIVIKIQLKKAKIILDSVQNELHHYERIEQESNFFYHNMKINRPTPLIQIPSNFLIKTHESISKKMIILQQKLKEIYEIVEFKLPKECEASSEYEFLIKLLQEIYIYYQYVSCQVVKLYQNLADLKKQLNEQMRDQFQIDLEQKLHNELVQNQDSDDQIKILAQISNKIEEKKKILTIKKQMEKDDLQTGQKLF